MMKRDQSDVQLENVLRLHRDVLSIREEERIFLKSYVSAIITPEMTFDRAAKLLITGYKRLKAESSGSCATQAATLCLALAEQFPQSSTLIKCFSSPFRVHRSDWHAKISFWKENHLSLNALEQFSPLFQSVTSVASESFSEACEHIVNETSDFGILPIENTTDGKLSAFYRMLDRYELKVCAVCDIEDPETDITTRMALVTRSLYFFEGVFRRHIELSYVTTEEDTKFDLIDVACAMGGSLTGFSSSPLSYRTNAHVETVRFSLLKNNTLPFLIYLHFFCEDINISGFYVQI